MFNGAFLFTDDNVKRFNVRSGSRHIFLSRATSPKDYWKPKITLPKLLHFRVRNLKYRKVVFTPPKNDVFTKQWPLAGEFVKFEYSPKICHFWRIRVLAKMVILENWPDSIYSPTFANLFWSDSIHSSTFANQFARTRYIRRHSPTCFGRTRYIRRVRRMYRVCRV